MSTASEVAPALAPPSDPSRPRRWPGLSGWILIGLVLGVAAGLLFGEACAWLGRFGEAFIGLLRMTILPFIVVSLIANLGRLTARQSFKLAGVGSVVLCVLWSLALASVALLPWSFPEHRAGSFFSTSLVEEEAPVDILGLFIPANIFAALAENHVPAVVVFCMCIGLALSGIDQRLALIQQLDILAKALARVSGFVSRLTPMGVFAIAANAAGTIALDEVWRLQAYLAAYTAATLLLGFVALPMLVTACTPLTYRDVMRVSRDGLVMAFATGKLLVALPLLVEQTEKYFRSQPRHGEQDAPAVDILYPLAYPFPHVGKLLGLLFIPFASWFLGNSLHYDEYPLFLGPGLVSYFGGPALAMPYLLELMRLPHDMFQMFLLTGVYCERLGDALGAMHLVAFTLITTCAFNGTLRIRWGAIARAGVTTLACGAVLLVGLRWGLARTAPYVAAREEVIAEMQLLEEPVQAVVLSDGTRNPDRLIPGEGLLGRIRRRGVIRVGFDDDKLPFAYFNGQGVLVGYDINMAHALARDLGVTIEFVPYGPATLAGQLANDEFDVAMSGLVGTLERAERMQHTAPYLELTLAIVVRDHEARQFRSLAAMRKIDNLRLGYVDLSQGFVQRVRELIPNATLVELPTNHEFFEQRQGQLDGLLISAEMGAAFTLLYPEFEVVLPQGVRIKLPLFYAVGARDGGLRDLLEHWVMLRRDDGTMQQFYEQWILGKIQRNRKPRWCILRDVLHWMK